MFAIGREIRIVAELSAIAGATYLYLQVLGLGLTRLLLGRRIASYQPWLAPWFGLMAAVLALFWLSRFGMSVEHAFYIVTPLGASLTLACLFWRRPLWPWPNRSDAYLAAGALVTLAVALYPMLWFAGAPTTMSFGNNDPALYAVASDYLRLHSLAHAPAEDPLRPSSMMLAYLLSPGHRPGVFLVLSVFDSLFRAPSYRVFSVVFAVLAALTTPLIAIFTHLLTGRRSCGKIALALSAVNVNFLYCYYQGFAAQIAVLGCILAGLILFLVQEHQNPPALSHSIAIGLAIIAMILLVPEGAVFFIVPYVLYISVRAVACSLPARGWLRRYGLSIAVVMAIGMSPVWNAALWLHEIRAIHFGWEIPQWALPVHLVGLMSAVGFPHSVILTIGLSLLVVAAIWRGANRCRNRLLIAVLLVFNIIVLIYFGAVRHYSYDYYKAGVMAGFVFIAAFSAGLPNQLYRYLGATCAVLALVSFMSSRHLVAAMARFQLGVTPQMAALTGIPSRITRREVISVDRLTLWERLWASQFMPQAAITAHDTFFSPRTPTALLLRRPSGDGTPGTVAKDVLWANDLYLLVKADQSSAAARPGDGIR